MAVSPDDLRLPRGLIDPEWFPGLDGAAVEDRIAEWIAEGERLTAAAGVDAGDVDTAVTHYVYHRAAQTVYLRLAHTPAQMSLEAAGSVTRTGDQMRVFRDLAAEHWAAYDALLPVRALPSRPAPVSSSTAHEFTW